MIQAALLLLCIIPLDVPVLRDSVDLTEINWFYDEHGHLVFQQAIFYDWCDTARRFQVRAWRLVKSDGQTPRYDWNSRRYVSQWIDNDKWRRVESRWFRETWLQYDPELLEREILPKEQRRELRSVTRPRREGE